MSKLYTKGSRQDLERKVEIAKSRLPKFTPAEIQSQVIAGRRKFNPLPRQISKAVSSVADPDDVGQMKDFLKEPSITEDEEWTESMIDMITGFEDLPQSEKKARRNYLQKFYEKKDKHPDEYHRHNVKLRELYDYADEHFVEESVLQDVEELIKEKNKDISEGVEDSDPIKDPYEIPYEYAPDRADLIDEDKLNDISNNLREIYWEEIRQKDRDAGWIDEFIQDQFQLDDREFLRASQMLRQTIRERNSQNIRKKRKKEWDWD